MRKIVIIPSKTPSISKTLVSYFDEAGWETYVMDGCSSIFEAYEKGMVESKVKPSDYVIMCHDDINILTNSIDFNSIIEGFLQKNKIGFLGVAGTKVLKESCVWWEGLKLHGSVYQSDHLAGIVYHGTSVMDMTSTYYGPTGKVVAMDGVFLACLGSTLLGMRLGKPKEFEGNWDFYDLYYTLQAHFKGLENYVTPISILHKSVGNIRGKESWHKNREALSKKLGDKLPVFVN